MSTVLFPQQSLWEHIQLHFLLQSPSPYIFTPKTSDISSIYVLPKSFPHVTPITVHKLYQSVSLTNWLSSKRDWVPQEYLGNFLKLWLEHLAVATPGSEEINHPRLRAVQHLLGKGPCPQFEHFTGQEVVDPGLDRVGITVPAGVTTGIVRKHWFIWFKESISPSLPPLLFLSLPPPLDLSAEVTTEILRKHWFIWSNESPVQTG